MNSINVKKIRNYMMDKNDFDIVPSNAFDLTADVLAFSSDLHINTFDTKQNSMCEQVFNRAGRENLKNDYVNATRIEMGGVLVTQGYDLSYKWLFHVYVPKNYNGTYHEADILAQCYKNSLIKANELGASSIVFSLLGSGKNGFRYIQAYDIAREAINEIAPALCKMKITIAVNNTKVCSKLKQFNGYYYEYMKQRYSEMNKVRGRFIVTEGNRKLNDIEKQHLYNTFEESIKEKVPEEQYSLVQKQIQKDKDDYLEKYPAKTETDFALHMISGIVNDWINSPVQSEKKQKYERKTRSASSLAKLIDVHPSTVSKLTNERSNLPSREMLISLAIGMQLDREERLHFILYGNDNLKYPQNLKEEYIEEILCDPNQDHDFNSVNNKVNEKFGETIRKTVERKENTCVKKKNHKKSKGKEK